MGAEKTRQEAQTRSRSQNLQQHLPSGAMPHAPERAQHAGGQHLAVTAGAACPSCRKETKGLQRSGGRMGRGVGIFQAETKPRG